MSKDDLKRIKDLLGVKRNFVYEETDKGYLEKKDLTDLSFSETMGIYNRGCYYSNKKNKKVF
ncbi:MAG: hypothetical protein GYA62_08875 [Bacteroidales bacterium]|nr:hypothetical protein [Bacteroidales bacterium]